MFLKQKSKESGQVLVILAVGIVVLLGFAALAIDGGMYYVDRRYDQNAADSAALAGGGAAGVALKAAGVGITGFDCSHAGVQTAMEAAENAAIASAAANGFTIDADISDGHGVKVTCADAGGSSGTYLAVNVWISTITQTSFAHLVFGGTFQNTVEAVSRITPGLSGPFAAEYSILALRSECTNKLGGIRVKGSIDVDVRTGKIYSNACLDSDGNAGLVQSTDGIFYITTLDDKHDVFVQPPDSPPQHVSDPIEISMDPLDAVCSALPEGQAVGCGVKEVCMTPGQYTSYRNTGGDDLILTPGLYCFTGEFSSNSGSVTVEGTYTDEEGVTFYLYKTGSFSVLGNSINELRAARSTAGVSLANGAVPGLLVQMDEDNNGQIDFGGGAGSFYRGTLFAPDGKIDFGGNTGMNGTQAVQVIADTIVLHGNPDVIVQYEDDDIYQEGGVPTLDFYK